MGCAKLNLYGDYNRLVEERNIPQNRKWTYSYDNGGNITSKQTSDLNGQPIGNPVAYDYAATGWKDQLISHNGISITYYFLDGSRIMAEKTGNSLMWYYYDESGVSGFRHIPNTGNMSSGVNYIFEKNILGDVVSIWNMSNGLKIGDYIYDAWGNHVEPTNPILQMNPFRYRGHYYDTETQLYYLQSRYYDPELGRFINADEPTMLFYTAGVVGGANLFVYCLNNPVMYVDPTGREPVILTITAIIQALPYVLAFAAVVLTGYLILTTDFSPLADAITDVVSWAQLQAIAVRNQIEVWLGPRAGPQTTYDPGYDAGYTFQNQGRSSNPTSKRFRFKTRKDAYQAAQRAGGNKKPQHIHLVASGVISIQINLVQMQAIIITIHLIGYMINCLNGKNLGGFYMEDFRMDKNIEEKFIKTFIDKRMQDRFLFEFSHRDSHKRAHAIDRFAHESDKYLKANYIHLADEKKSIDDAEKENRSLSGVTKNCYIMDTAHDGETMPLRAALEISYAWPGVSIIIVSDNVAFLKTEQSFGSPMKLILHKKS